MDAREVKALLDEMANDCDYLTRRLARLKQNVNWLIQHTAAEAVKKEEETK